MFATMEFDTEEIKKLEYLFEAEISNEDDLEDAIRLLIEKTERRAENG